MRVHCLGEPELVQRGGVLREPRLQGRELGSRLGRGGPLRSACGLGEPHGQGGWRRHLLEELGLGADVVDGARDGGLEVGLRDLRPAADVHPRLLLDHRPVHEDELEHVALHARGVAELGDAHRQRARHHALCVVLAAVAEDAVGVAQDGRVAGVRLLPSRDGVFADRVRLLANVHGAALERARERVAVDLLQQSAARSKVHRVRTEAVGEERGEHVAHGVEGDAVPLQHPHVLADEAAEGVAAGANLGADFGDGLLPCGSLRVGSVKFGREGGHL
mmetsp:Transcript_52210/g.117272  ORF Transcript_52210/g.117272 Transcript_52210/m.117272 type:complete len:276 (-) Transcript_52210:1880-2707(-)